MAERLDDDALDVDAWASGDAAVESTQHAPELDPAGPEPSETPRSRTRRALAWTALAVAVLAVVVAVLIWVRGSDDGADISGSTPSAGSPCDVYTTPQDTDTELERCDKGTRVAQLQADLEALDFDLGEGGVDGCYGPDTESAVRAFQRDNELTVDGRVGPMTRSELDQALESADRSGQDDLQSTMAEHCLD